ncbi:MAG: hypothetical protein GX896_10435 [Clostridiales bacterium]|nr:hypothetical protein [Clostridiales bacterium]
MKTNERSEELGLRLSEQDAKMLADESKASINENERIEINSDSSTVKIIEKFMQSTYIGQTDYAQTMAGLIDVFYVAKEESNEFLTDDELIDIMYNFFERESGGSIELLQTRDLEILCREIRNKLNQIL